MDPALINLIGLIATALIAGWFKYRGDLKIKKLEQGQKNHEEAQKKKEAAYEESQKAVTQLEAKVEELRRDYDDLRDKYQDLNKHNTILETHHEVLKNRLKELGRYKNQQLKINRLTKALYNYYKEPSISASVEAFDKELMK